MLNSTFNYSNKNCNNLNGRKDDSKKLIEALSQYPEDAEIVSIEVDNWASFLQQNKKPKDFMQKRLVTLI